MRQEPAAVAQAAQVTRLVASHRPRLQEKRHESGNVDVRGMQTETVEMPISR
jgi:hypothetical protein